MDTHFFSAPLEKNAPVILALLGVWNRNFLGLPCRAVVPYASRLARFPAHLQQLEMESNGKGVTIDTHQPIVGYDVGEIVLGEPGTDAQHSFFQFLHAASTTVPVDFVGFLKGEDKQGHNLLMANFFAQPDALALGTKLTATLPYKVFHGDRPSLTILFPQLTPYAVGALLAMYEHRTAVQGWLWNVNSFDQFGVELGKTLATDILGLLDGRHTTERRLNPSTSRLLEEYRTVNAAENTQAKS